MHHRAEDRIRGHVFECILALLLERVVERDTGQSWAETRQHFSRLKMVAYEGSGGRVVQTTEPTREQRKVLKTLEIQPPKMVHQAG
jgi:hypothetical protein